MRPGNPARRAHGEELPINAAREMADQTANSHDHDRGAFVPTAA